MSDVKISVIMPVYKVEKFIKKAIESIQTQTLKEFEFLIVNDGTPDESGRICDEYAEKDPRIHVIHKENGGAPSARNTAMEIAVGKYFYFMDSDDWAEPTMLQDMYELAEKNQLEMVIAGYYIDTYYDDTNYISTELSQPDQIFQTQQDFREQAYRLFDLNLLYTPWNKLYLAEFIKANNIRFSDTFWDDFPFNLSVVRDIEKVGITSEKYYHFMRARSESETTKYRSDMYQKREEEHQWMLDLYKHWQIKDYKSMEMVHRRYIERIVGCIENITTPNCTLTTAEKKAEIKTILGNPHVPRALRMAQPRSIYMKLMLKPIKWKNVNLAYLEGKAISAIKGKNVKMFASLKAKR